LKSYDALNRAINRQTVEHARRLHVSTSLVHKWQEPAVDFTDSGAYNPLDRIETIIETALSLGVKPEDALAPIYYLAERFGQIVIPIPKTENTAAAASGELLKTVQEFGELASEASKALQDGKITWQEHDRINREAWELIRQVALFLRIVETSVRK